MKVIRERTVCYEEFKGSRIALAFAGLLVGFLLALYIAEIPWQKSWKASFVLIFWGGGLAYLFSLGAALKSRLFDAIRNSSYHHRISYFVWRAYERGEKVFKERGVIDEIILLGGSLIGVFTLSLLILAPYPLWKEFSNSFNVTDFFLLGTPFLLLWTWWLVVCSSPLVRLLIEIVFFLCRLVLRPIGKILMFAGKILVFSSKAD